MLALIAGCGLVFGIWASYFDPVRQWQSAIRDDNNGLRRWEAISQAQFGRAQGIDRSMAVASLADALSHPSVRVRQTAALGLPRLGPDSRGARPALVGALRDKDYLVRAFSADALGDVVIDPGDPYRVEVISALKEALKDPNGEVRFSAGLALARQGEGKSAIAALIEALSPRYAMNRQRAIWGLSHVAPTEARAAIPALLGVVADSANAVNDVPLIVARVHAAELLLDLGEKEIGLKILHDAEKSENAIINVEAQRVLKRVSPENNPTKKPAGKNRLHG